jgi:formiminotetrahydrofolate cyclodeaminase
VLRNLGFIELLDEISSKKPAPGGGSAAGVAGATGCSLVMMVCGLTIGKKKYAGVREEVEEVMKEAEELRGQFLSLIDEDTDAFMRLFEFFKLKEMTPEQETGMKEAEAEAIAVPQRTMVASLAAMKAAAKLAPIGNKNAISDVGVAVHFLHTAFRGGELNVLINLSGKEEMQRRKYEEWLTEMNTEFDAAHQSALDAVQKRMD